MLRTCHRSSLHSSAVVLWTWMLKMFHEWMSWYECCMYILCPWSSSGTWHFSLYISKHPCAYFITATGMDSLQKQLPVTTFSKVCILVLICWCLLVIFVFSLVAVPSSFEEDISGTPNCLFESRCTHGSPFVSGLFLHGSTGSSFNSICWLYCQIYYESCIMHLGAVVMRYPLLIWSSSELLCLLRQTCARNFLRMLLIL